MLLIRLAPNCVMHHGLGEVLRDVLEGFSNLISRAVLRVFGKSWLSDVGSENSDLFHSGNSEPFGNGRTMIERRGIAGGTAGIWIVVHREKGDLAGGECR